jgi:hypothetical protein
MVSFACPLLAAGHHSCAQVESFMGGSAGAHVVRLEAELAGARLALAEAESEKDDLEQELSSVLRGEGSRDYDEGDQDEEEDVEVGDSENDQQQQQQQQQLAKPTTAPVASSSASAYRRPLGNRSNVSHGKAPTGASAAAKAPAPSAAKRVVRERESGGAAATCGGVRRVLALESGV